jgi:hypothetical protein
MRRLALLRTSLLAAALVVAAAARAATPAHSGPSWDFGHGDLRVSESRRFLVHADGTPFWWQGDTAWELFHRLTREEAERYLEVRRQQGFTVIQAVALAELDGLNTPNAYGHRPFAENDPARPDVKEGPRNDYWDLVEDVVGAARAKGIYVGILPTWGDKLGPKLWGEGPVVFTVDNARVYGRWLGGRFKDAPNVVWILGGDRPADATAVVWRAMAAGLAEGDGGRHLKTYHPVGGHSSALWFHGDDWLDFNMLQSGHGRRDEANWQMVASDYARLPVKPVLDGEARYEDHPVNWNPQNGWFDDFDVRQAAYWALFAGAFGHTYGCHDVWQMNAPGRTPISFARNFWYDVLDLPGAWDMLHLRRLMLSRPFLTRVPDALLVASGHGDGIDHVQATRDRDGAYAFVYLPTGRRATMDLTRLRGPRFRAWWFDPRTGTATTAGEVEATGTHEFDPPGEPGRGNDWVLVLDDASRSFPPPGTSR